MAGINLDSSSMRTVRTLDDALDDSTAGVAHPVRTAVSRLARECRLLNMLYDIGSSSGGSKWRKYVEYQVGKSECLKRRAPVSLSDAARLYWYYSSLRTKSIVKMRMSPS